MFLAESALDKSAVYRSFLTGEGDEDCSSILLLLLCRRRRRLTAAPVATGGGGSAVCCRRYASAVATTSTSSGRRTTDTPSRGTILPCSPTSLRPTHPSVSLRHIFNILRLMSVWDGGPGLRQSARPFSLPATRHLHEEQLQAGA